MTELYVRQICVALAEHWARQYGISPEDILGYSHRKNISEARQRVYLEAHKAGASLAAIGRAMNRDHTSIRHGVFKAAQRLAA